MNNMNKEYEQNGKFQFFSEVHIPFPFLLILTSGPILNCTEPPMGCFELENAFQGGL